MWPYYTEDGGALPYEPERGLAVRSRQGFVTAAHCKSALRLSRFLAAMRDEPLVIKAPHEPA